MRTKKSKHQPLKKVRCAVYTRKSHAEGLDQEFNSLDAQRESAEAYIASQRGQGWVALDDRYDDAAYSAATMERPALKRLLADVERGRIDAAVVYRIDRLSRSLRDFGRLMELFEQHGVSFVSVTQHFDTSTSLGKLVLNILMSFAEFEREVTRERILDKIAAAKRRGLHCGGVPVLGYDTVDKRLVVNEREAKLVRKVFRRFTELASAHKVAAELNRRGHRTKAWTTNKGVVRGGGSWDKLKVHHVLHNRKYLGEVTHHGQSYPGEHEAIVPKKLWDDVHRILEENCRARSNVSRAETVALLKGVIKCGHCGRSMGPTFSRKRGRTYRYYLCTRASRNGHDTCPVRTVAAGTVENAVVNQLRAVFRTPEVIARTYREAKARESEELERLRGEKVELETRLKTLKETAAQQISGGGAVADELRRSGEEMDDTQQRLDAATHDLRALESQAVTEREVIDALQQIDPIWNELFPAEQHRIVQLLVERVDVHPEGLEVRLRADGLRSLVAEVSDREESS